eukprot:COSAG05_NODE_2903_length_2524_cov_2.885773_2_plen_122_part_01
MKRSPSHIAVYLQRGVLSRVIRWDERCLSCSLLLRQHPLPQCLISWLVQHHKAKRLFRAVRPRHLDEGVHIAHSRYELRDERLQHVLQRDRVRLVPGDLSEQLLHIAVYLQRVVLSRVIQWD